MRPRSALRRPPSAGPARPPSAAAVSKTAVAADEQRRRIGHQFAHALREKISIHRHAMNLSDAPSASQESASLTGETDREYYSVLRNREDRTRTTIHRLATKQGDDVDFAELLPVLNLDGATVVSVVAIDGVVNVQLSTWTDVDGVTVTDEPRTLRVFPPQGVGNAASTASPHESAGKFAQGSLMLSALGAAGVVDASHDGGGGPRGFSLNAVSLRALRAVCPGHYRHLLSPTPKPTTGDAVDSFADDGMMGMCFVVSLDSFHSKALSVRPLRPPTALADMRIVCEPFSEAELFQWFYLQLALRAHVDAALDPNVYLCSAGPSPSLRADLIARHHRHCTGSDQQQALAFEPPDGSGARYVVLPPSTPVITLVGLEGIVRGVSAQIAGHGDGGTTSWTELLGWRDIPVVSSFARHVLRTWASKVQVRDSHDAFTALQELFDLFYPLYGTTRSALLEYRVAPRVFLSGPRAHRRLKKFPFLSEFVTAPVLRPSVIPKLATTPEQQHGVDALGDSSQLAPLGERKVSTVSPMVVTTSHTRVQEECGFLIDRWKSYIGHPQSSDGGARCGDVSVFESHDESYLSKVTLLEVLGRGGSGLVFKGIIEHPVYEVPIVVAVKCFIFPDGMDHATYVRECLTDVAFFAVFNEVDASGVSPSVRMYDFFLTSQRLQGMEDGDWRTCLHNQPTDGTVNLCYLITELVDKTVGRFLTASDENYDPCYDELINRPFDDLQTFLFLYSQLILRGEFDNYVVHDLMLNGQLRGDNLGLISIERLVSKEARRRRRLSASATPRQGGCANETTQEDNRDGSHAPAVQRRFVWFQYCEPPGDGTPQYLKFPLADWSDGTMGGAAFYVVFIDVGQGQYKKVQSLYDRGLIGCPTVESCLVDDNMGRYWPHESLFAKDISATGEAGKTALALAAGMKVADATAAVEHLHTLLRHFKTMGYGADAGEEPSAQDVADRLVWTCTRESLDHLHATYIYSDAYTSL